MSLSIPTVHTVPTPWYLCLLFVLHGRKLNLPRPPKQRRPVSPSPGNDTSASQTSTPLHHHRRQLDTHQPPATVAISNSRLKASSRPPLSLSFSFKLPHPPKCLSRNSGKSQPWRPPRQASSTFVSFDASDEALLSNLDTVFLVSRVILNI